MKKLLLMTAVLMSTLALAKNPFNVKIENNKLFSESISSVTGTLTYLGEIPSGLSYLYSVSGPTPPTTLYLFLNGVNTWTVIEPNSTFDVDKWFFNPEIMDNQNVYSVSLVYFDSGRPPMMQYANTYAF